MFISTDMQLDQRHLKIFPGAVSQGKSAERSPSPGREVRSAKKIPYWRRLRCMAMLYGLQLPQGLSLAVLPSREADLMPTMNYSSGRTGSRKLNVSCKTKRLRIHHQ